MNNNNWGESRKEIEMVGAEAGMRGRMDGTDETGVVMIRAFISGRKL